MQSLLRTLAVFVLLITAVSAHAGFPNDLSDVEFIEAGQVKSWPVTGSFTTMSVSGDFLVMPYSTADSWPRITINGTSVVSNVWGIVKRDGRWKAGTWDWMRPGQISKPKKAFGGCCHFRGGIGNFSPRNGEVFGFFFSGTARSGVVNTAQRTNFVVYEWGRGVIGREGGSTPAPAPEPEQPKVPVPAIDLLLDSDR